MIFTPLHDRVLLKRVDAEEKTPGGVIIPETAQEIPLQAEVLAIGPGVADEVGKLRPLGVKAGDRVLIPKWDGTELLIGGEERLIVKESQILGIIGPSTRSKGKAGQPDRTQRTHA
jgi:chaperonin GroES